MISSPQPFYVSADHYLELEAQSPVKHEYIDGQIIAMAGVSDAHVTIALNLAADLGRLTRGSGCRVFISDMKVRIDSLKSVLLPRCFGDL